MPSKEDTQHNFDWHQSQSQEDSTSSAESERPLCSVLSTVVDHVMLPPTPMETEEFQEYENSANKSSPPILVPVLRVFGPIVRGDAPSGKDPVQSACLYIHGAYPYLLARPVLAGPDGSLHHSSHLRGHLTGSGHIDWDSTDAVERVASVVHDNLEATLQASVIGGKGGPNTYKAKDPVTPIFKFIRKVTVVVGRGFYTYCPGPPAPFLRVEYYDPKVRWKVKVTLERGLELPHMYHPDPQQYDAVGLAPAADSSQMDLDPLRFHCYEAHIPYTMQFFKDWNLAGMSYIHLSHGRFRPELPSKFVPRWEKNTGRADENDDESRLAFLGSNTPSHSIWGKGHPHEKVKIRAANLQSSPRKADKPGNIASDLTDGICIGESFTPEKRTSCDVEIDADVNAIMNVKAIMTALPDNIGEGQNIHWRAVPSLREIWQEERQRMAKLLPPKDNFLSNETQPSTTSEGVGITGKHNDTPTFTLSVKKDAPNSDAMSAVKGMKHLLNITDGLEEDFMRALRQIVERHAAAVSQVDRQLRSPPPTGETSPHGTLKSDPHMTPSDKEALEALGALASQFSNTAVAENTDAGDSGLSSVEDSTQHSFSSESFGALQKVTTEKNTFGPLSQTYYTSQPFSSRDDDVEDYVEMSQRVDRGDSVVDGPFQYVEDFLDPETLAPYDTPEDDSDDEQGLDEATMEQVLTDLATQMDKPTREKAVNEGTAGDLANQSSNNDSEESSSEENSVVSEVGTSSRGDYIVHRSLHSAEAEGKLDRATLSQNEQHPPSRASLRASSVNFLQLPERSREKVIQPSWLSHRSTYESYRESSGAESGRNWLPEIPAEGLLIQPTNLPPRRDEVLFSRRRETKRTLQQGCTHSVIKKRLPDDLACGNLQLSGDPVDSVEEMHWVPSQSQCLSLSQEAPQRDNVEAKAANPSAIPQNFTAASLSDTQTQNKALANTYSTAQFEDSSDNHPQPHALFGMHNQGGKLCVEGGGQLKAITRPSDNNAKDNGPPGPKALKSINVEDFNRRYLPTPLIMVSVEVHVQCRNGQAGVKSSKTIAMTADPEKDKISAICYVFGKDPGGGGALQILEQGCFFVPTEGECGDGSTRSSRSHHSALRSCMPGKILGVLCPTFDLEAVKDERSLLYRLASKFRKRDPDMCVSWDTQGAGLGYIIERGARLGQEDAVNNDVKCKGLDMVRLLGRMPKGDTTAAVEDSTLFKSESDGPRDPSWSGSGLGSDWDDRVGAGSAAASIVGRLVFSGWKIVAEEVKHPNNSYLPAMVSTVLGKRIPHHDELVLTNWYAFKKGRERWRVLHHKLVQGTATLMLFDALDIVGRAGEAARLSGVEFSQSFPGIRGSQYKVEGVLLRALKSLNSQERGSKRGERKPGDGTNSSGFSEESKSQSQSPWKKRRKAMSVNMGQNLQGCGYFFFSPSLQGANKQEALEVQALTLEPHSGHHTDPVVVCDFTALYPSLVIAYNLCYSTCAGKLSYHTTRREMFQEGKTTGRVGPFLYSESRTATVLKHHFNSFQERGKSDDFIHPKDRAYVAPTGTIYVSETVVRGVLPQVLDELLSTRAMLKKASKEYKRLIPDLAPCILRQLEARQLALKYVANVTYGYTSATFSGRCAMPLLADTIVECGRRTLTSAINLANRWGKQQGGKWYGCEVLYGDTDSVFIKLPGRSVEEAFDFGKQFCDEVTSCNPPPVQLKLEKVYLGSILQTKKKYCGMKFESSDAKSPEFEAKGIETVRRDQCALTQKILRNSLTTLFRYGINEVKSYLFRQWSLILSGRLPISDFILTGRVRSKYRGGKIGPVQAALFRRLAEVDPGRVIRHKERLAYVIVATPGIAFRLRDCVVTPLELMEQWDAVTLHSTYYIVKHVNAALQRCFGLAPHYVDINAWYQNCPKPRRRIHFWPNSAIKTANSSMISQFFGSDLCSLCGNKCKAQGRARAVICSSCREDDVGAFLVVAEKLRKAQTRAHELAKRCSACNLCFEDSSTFAAITAEENGRKIGDTGSRRGQSIAIPIAACTCTDCPTTYERHRLREENLEADAICKALDIVP